MLTMEHGTDDSIIVVTRSLSGFRNFLKDVFITALIYISTIEGAGPWLNYAHSDCIC